MTKLEKERNNGGSKDINDLPSLNYIYWKMNNDP